MLNVAELQRGKHDHVFTWTPLEAEVKFLQGQFKLHQGEFDGALTLFKEATDALEVAKSDAGHVPTHFGDFA